jgi:SAM-dependent methyltransferase
MFDLRELRGLRVLDCGAGPSTFAHEAARRGAQVIAVDTMYEHDLRCMRMHVSRAAAELRTHLITHIDRYEWSHFRSPDALIEHRLRTLERFESAFASPGRERYVSAALPHLPFPDQLFDLALSSHLLFLHSGTLGNESTIEGVQELTRIAREVRLYPLVDMQGQPSQVVPPVLRWARDCGLLVRMVPTAYRIQRSATHFLCIHRPESSRTHPGDR